MNARWKARFQRIRFFGWIALGGLVCGIVALLTAEEFRNFFTVLFILLFIPAFVYIYVMTILHWKDRYRGRHSDLWGVLILIETSGWLKLVYLLRHMIPDMTKSGRYRPVISPPQSD